MSRVWLIVGTLFGFTAALVIAMAFLQWGYSRPTDVWVVENTTEKNDVVMTFVSNTEYGQGQQGQVIVELRRQMTGVSLLDGSCYQGYPNNTITCTGTQGVSNWSYDTHNVYIDYVVPQGVTQAKSLAKSAANGYVPTNYTVDECLVNGTLQMKLFDRYSGGNPYFETSWNCKNATGGWKEFYYASIPPGPTNYGIGTNMSPMFDGDWNTWICKSVLGWNENGPLSYLNCAYNAEITKFYEQGVWWNMSNCLIDIWYPNKTMFYEGYAIVGSDSENGYVNFTVPSIDGVYEYQARCYVDGKEYVSSKSFHVTKRRISAVVAK